MQVRFRSKSLKFRKMRVLRNLDKNVKVVLEVVGITSFHKYQANMSLGGKIESIAIEKKRERVNREGEKSLRQTRRVEGTEIDHWMPASIKETVGVIVSRAFHRQRIEVKVFYDARSLSSLGSSEDYHARCESKKLNLPLERSLEEISRAK